MHGRWVAWASSSFRERRSSLPQTRLTSCAGSPPSSGRPGRGEASASYHSPKVCQPRPHRHGRWRRCDPNTFCWTHSLDCWISNQLLACPVRRQKHRWLHQLPPHVVWANVAMQRGPFSVTHGHLEDHVLQWLQADPYWSELGRRAAEDPQKNSRCMAASEEEFKHEEGGYTGRQAPGCKTCNTIDMGRPLQATRVSAWVRCFCNSTGVG